MDGRGRGCDGEPKVSLLVVGGGGPRRQWVGVGFEVEEKGIERGTQIVPQEAWGVRGACGRTHCTVETKHRLQVALRMQYNSTTDHSV
jgi:hypothetical protein